MEKLATEIDWKVVEDIWATNQPFVRLRKTNNKRRGQTHGKQVYAVDTDKDLEIRKTNPDFSKATFSLPSGDYTEKFDPDLLRFRCSGMC